MIVLGGGPNRIGQGIEFDYCCVKALLAVKAAGFESIMINCNPETVSTDYDMVDRLYFEPITLESILDIVELEKPLGVILQFGGQTPLKLAQLLDKAKVNILGTGFKTIDLTENRKRFSTIIKRLQIKQPRNSFAQSIEEAKKAATKLGFPLIVRPSYVLGGSAMKIVRNEKELSKTWQAIQKMTKATVLLDEYLENAIEIDVDGVCDNAGNFIIAGIMEHIEPAGIHSGDSSCVIPTVNLNKETIEVIKDYTTKIIKHFKIVGFINIQFAVCENLVYVLEVNPRASRTIPFVSKARHTPYVEIATKCLLGIDLVEQSINKVNIYKKPYYCVKHSIFPFNKFPDTILNLGPEMRSTGEVMGIDINFLKAYKKSLQDLNKLNSTKSINVFIECSTKEAQEIVDKLKLLQKKQPNGFNIYSLALLSKTLKKEKLQTNIVSTDKLKLLLRKNLLNMVVLTKNGKYSDKLRGDLSINIINHHIAHALTINTAKVILSSLLVSNKYKTFSTKKWFHYLH